MARAPRSVFVNVPAGERDFEVAPAIPAHALRVHQVILVCGAEATDVTFNSMGSSGDGLCLSVSGGSGASTPDQVGLAATSTIDLRQKMSADTWGSGAFQAIVSQDNNAVGGRFWFGLHADGIPEYDFYTSDSRSLSISANASPEFEDDSIHWVRVLHDIIAGTVDFYTSDDGIAWTSLGDQQPIDAVSMSTAGTAPIVRVGTDVYADHLSGKIYHTTVIIDGVAILNENWSTATFGTGPWVAGTGETWTAIGSATVLNSMSVAISPLLANASNGGAVLPYTPIGWFTTVSGEALTVTTSAGSTVGILLALQEH